VTPEPAPLLIRDLGMRPYAEVWQAMRDFTDSRGAGTPSELWQVEHPPVFTQGQAGRPEHLLAPGRIPVVQTDRGGQVTYHGPGQLVIYLLVRLRDTGLGVRALVLALEQAVIDLLADHRIVAEARRDAPGVYVGGRKLASLGLRVRHGCTYHGLALNVDMDLEPFTRIHPCGLVDMQVTQLRDLGLALDTTTAAQSLVPRLADALNHTLSVADPG
jgi:lipoyl(octanoyl) transferase